MHTLEIFFREKGEAKGFFSLLCFYFCFRFSFAFVHLVAYFDLFHYEGHGRGEGGQGGLGSEGNSGA